jgi:hypothetical protein
VSSRFDQYIFSYPWRLCVLSEASVSTVFFLPARTGGAGGTCTLHVFPPSHADERNEYMGRSDRRICEGKASLFSVPTVLCIQPRNTRNTRNGSKPDVVPCKATTPKASDPRTGNRSSSTGRNACFTRPPTWQRGHPARQYFVHFAYFVVRDFLNECYSNFSQRVPPVTRPEACKEQGGTAPSRIDFFVSAPSNGAYPCHSH